MLSFIRMFRGTFHMMFCRLNWSSQATVIAPTMPSFRPAVWSVRRAPPKKKEIGIMSSPHLDAGHRHRPVLPRGLETRDCLAARLQGGVVALRVARIPDHRDDRGGLVERVEHRVVVFVQLVEFRLLDLDRRADRACSVSPSVRLIICLDMYLGVSMEIRGRSAFHHRENPGRSPSITPPDEPSTRMNICFPLCAYSMNHTGACSNSPSYVVG